MKHPDAGIFCVVKQHAERFVRILCKQCKVMAPGVANWFNNMVDEFQIPSNSKSDHLFN